MVSGKRDGPRAGSRAYRALQALQECGPLVTPSWIVAAAYFEAPSSFHSQVVAPLLRAGLIAQERLHYAMTAAGLKYLGIEPTPSAPKVITPGAYVPPRRDLSPRNRAPLRAMRPGALDYLDIPSRIGDQVIPHGEKAAA